MPAARRTVTPMLAALAVVALVVGAVWLTRGHGLGPVAGAGSRPPVLHIGTPVAYGNPATRDGRYVVTGTLPVSPTSAAVRRVEASEVSARVAALADALGLRAPQRHGDLWRATDGAAVLVVSARAGNQWSYARDSGGCPLPMDPRTGGPSAVVCGPVPLPSAAPAVDPVTARAQAERVLRAANPGDCSPCRASWGTGTGPQVQYETTPTIGGAAALGYQSTATVTASGVVAAGGWLGGTSAGATYPLITPRAGLEQLAHQPQPAIGCALPGPGSPPDDVPLVCRARVDVTGAQLGLSLRWDSGTTPLLVPTWVFSIAHSSEHLQVVAVAPAYLADPPERTSSPGPGSGGSGSGSVGTGSVGPASAVPPAAASDLPLPAAS